MNKFGVEIQAPAEFSLAFYTNGSTIGELEQITRQIAQRYGLENPTGQQLTEIEQVILATINLARSISKHPDTKTEISRLKPVQPGETIHHAVTLQGNVLSVVIFDAISGSASLEVSVKLRKRPNGGVIINPLLGKIATELAKFTTESSALPYAVLAQIQNLQVSQ